MKHEDRRHELGKMLLDISKYIVTVGVIGSFITDKLTFNVGAIIIIIAIIIMIAGYYIIPPKKKGE